MKSPTKLLGISAILLIAPGYLLSQKVDPSGFTKCGDGYKSPIYQTECSGFRNEPGTDLNWRNILTNKCVAYEPEGPNHDSIKELKENKLKGKLSYQVEPKDGNDISAITPMVGNNFMGNTNNGSSPMDNSVAISNGGKIVSVANTTIQYLDFTGTSLYFNTIAGFIGDPGITNVCDPVVVYDPQADRFVFFAQECAGNSANSYLLICFSKTNDPNDGWWYYKITGNPLSDGSWFDYPKLALSNNELYITGNLFYNGGPFNRSVLYQINKNTGYSGATLAWQYWQGLTGSPFTLLPVSHGQGGAYGPGCLLVATDAGGSSLIKLYQLTDDLGGSPTINYYPISTTAYSPAADSYQMGTSCLLDNGDCRALSGFYLDGFIHFVFHSDIGSGWNGINYNRLNLSTGVNTSSMFGLPGTHDCSFPSISSFATSGTDKSVMIGFGTSSNSSYPEIRVVNCDNGMNWSTSTVVKTSESFVSYTSSTEERWGDYTGTARKHNAGSPTIWMNGMYGTSGNVWNTWIAEINGSGVTAIEPSQDITGSKIYPNPIIETFNLEFSLNDETPIIVELFDMNGRMVKVLFNGIANAGDNVFSFNKAQLEAGNYLLMVKNESKTILHEKIIITD